MPAAVDVRLLRAAVFAAACVALAAGGHVAASGGGVAPGTAVLGWLIVFVLAATLTGRQRHSLPAVATLLAGIQLALHGVFSLGHQGGGAVTGGAGGSGGVRAGGEQHGLLDLAARLLCNEHALALTTAEAERLVRDAGLTPPSAGPAGPAAEYAEHHAAGADVLPLPLLSADAAAAFQDLADPSMLAGHLLAALLAGWLLLRGEAALWRLIRLSVLSARRLPLPLRQVLRQALARARLLARGLRPAALPAPPRPPAAGPHPTSATRGTVLPDAVIRRGPPSAAEYLTLAA
jgi:hypothetical protein